MFSEEKTPVDIWQERYYELEFTLEQTLLGFEKVLSQVEKKKSGEPEFPVGIYRITQLEADGQKFICCVANGINMEFMFEFFAGEKLTHLQGYGRMNSAPIPSDRSLDSCKVTFKSHFGKEPKIQSQEIKL